MRKINNKILFLNALLICMITFSSCMVNQSIKWENRFNHLPKEIKCDTIEGVFLYEDLMSYQTSADVFVKTQSFIHFGTVGKQLYEKGIFIYGDFNSDIQKSAQENSNLFLDFSSVHKMIMQIRYDDIQEKHSDLDFNTCYGLGYTKFHLKMEVLYLGKVKQRIPVFFNNKTALQKYMKEHHGKDYEVCTIPTYLITRVFKWKEIK